MPKTFAQIRKLGKVPGKRIGGKKLDFAPVLASILKSGQAWTVKEVTEDLAKGVLSRQRIMKLLNAQVATKTLTVFDVQGTYHYIDTNQVPKVNRPKPKK